MLQINSEHQTNAVQEEYSDYGKDSWRRRFQDFCDVAKVIVATKSTVSSS